MKADVLCFQKISCHESEEMPQIPGYSCYSAIAGISKPYKQRCINDSHGKGVATYVKTHLIEKKKLLGAKRLPFDTELSTYPDQFSHEVFQGQILMFEDINILNINHTPSKVWGNCGLSSNFEELAKCLKLYVDPNKNALICSDMSFDFWKEPSNEVAAALKKKGFQQIAKQSSIRGSMHTHIYLKGEFLYKSKLYYPTFNYCYSSEHIFCEPEHESVCIMLKKPVTKKL